MALVRDTIRDYELGNLNDLLVEAEAKIFEGAAVGANRSTGYVRPLVAGDAFVGFAERIADNFLGQNGENTARVKCRGAIKLYVSTSDLTKINAPVYAADDNTFTLNATGNSCIGKIKRFVGNGICIVEFESETEV